MQSYCNGAVMALVLYVDLLSHAIEECLMKVRPLVRSVGILGIYLFSIGVSEMVLIDPLTNLGLSGHKSFHIAYYFGVLLLIFIAPRYIEPGLYRTQVSGFRLGHNCQ